jgi:GH24 family phage-related lysozyme (muramidase)
MNDYEVSERLVQGIMRKHGFHAQPYWNDRGQLAIGYNQTLQVERGDIWTEKEAELDLRASLSEFATQLKGMLKQQVTQQQFDWLVEFAYILGINQLKNGHLEKIIGGE